MHPIICQIGPVTIYSFGLMFLTALLVCSYFLGQEAKRYAISKEAMYDFIFWTIMAGIIGARIFYIILNFSFFWENPGEIVMLQKGGLAWQGGMILGVVAAALFVRRIKIPFLFMADLVVPYLALGQGIGRLGCFLNGCCYGRPAAWGIYFPAHDARLIPTQLYDFGGLFFIFLILKYLQKVVPKQGQVLAIYLILASLERFANEFFRADHATLYWGMSVFQLVSAGVFVVGVVLFFVLQKLSHASLTALSKK